MYKQKRKIIFYIKDPNGGPCRFLENINNILAKTNIYDVTIITHKETKGFFLKTKKIGFSIDKQTNFSPLKIFLSFINFLLFYKNILDIKPDIIVSFGIFDNIATGIVKIIKPKIKIIHSSNVNLKKSLLDGRNPLFSSFLKLLVIFIYKKSDKHFTLCEGLKKQLINDFEVDPEKIIVISNPINFNRINFLAKESIKEKKLLDNFKNKKITKIFTMGRFDDQKNFPLTFQITKLLLENRQNIKLFVLGDGKLKESYKDQVKNLNIKKSVYFLGWQKNPYKFLKYADLFIFFTNYEGSPYSLLEAGSLGVFSIVSNIDFGPREILTRNSGVLIDNNYSPKHIADLINNVLDREINIISKRKIIKEMKRFDINYLKKRYIALLN